MFQPPRLKRGECVPESRVSQLEAHRQSGEQDLMASFRLCLQASPRGDLSSGPAVHTDRSTHLLLLFGLEPPGVLSLPRVPSPLSSQGNPLTLGLSVSPPLRCHHAAQIWCCIHSPCFYCLIAAITTCTISSLFLLLLLRIFPLFE